MPKHFQITAAVEMPDGLAAQSIAISKMQPAVDAFKAALEKAGYAPVVTERLTQPTGPRGAKGDAGTPLVPVVDMGVEEA